ncbi:hypothetical protein BJ912DRAFT_1100744 [Pholiota molesta]|nr:hypothetical protein BJ912DRAFT_1100744 [Pholiota molesta]
MSPGRLTVHPWALGTVTFTYCTGTLKLAPLPRSWYVTDVRALSLPYILTMTTPRVRPGPTSLARPPQRAPAGPAHIDANGAHAHAHHEPEGQPSAAITRGADRLLALIEGEKAAVTAAHAADVRALEAELAALTTHGARALAAAEVRARGAEREAAALRAEHARLLAGVGAVGLEYAAAEGALRFAPATARIVEDFVLGARLQEEQMRGTQGGGGVGWVGSDSDAALFESVGPAQFFGVLGSVLEKGRAYAEAIEQHQQNESATASYSTAHKGRGMGMASFAFSAHPVPTAAPAYPSATAAASQALAQTLLEEAHLADGESHHYTAAQLCAGERELAGAAEPCAQAERIESEREGLCFINKLSIELLPAANLKTSCLKFLSIRQTLGVKHSASTSLGTGYHEAALDTDSHSIEAGVQTSLKKETRLRHQEIVVGCVIGSIEGDQAEQFFLLL